MGDASKTKRDEDRHSGFTHGGDRMLTMGTVMVITRERAS